MVSWRPIVNELLCFLYNSFAKVPKGKILVTLVSFYSDDEVVRAKEVLFDFAEGYTPKIDGLPRMKTRREGNNRRRLDCEDIFGLVELLDKRSIVVPEFHASKLHRLPSFSPTEVDSVRMAQTVEDLKRQVKVLTDQFDEMKNLMVKASLDNPC